MLQAMQQPVQSEPSPKNFAGFLAALTAPQWKVSGDRPSAQAEKLPAPWNDDGLEDDIATLSYEHALRAHARYRPAPPTDESLTQAADPAWLRAPASSPVAAPSAVPLTSNANAGPSTAQSLSAAQDRNLKCASITIRLSQAECAQLRQRAAEAGLTVSAYLRSCTFEAESLRALVKDTLAQLRSATAAGKQVASPPSRRSWLHAFVHFFAPWRTTGNPANA
jgi:hypothetical protein